jgi:histidinol-phosphatase (PHP family)
VIAPVDNHSHILSSDILDMVISARKHGIVEYSITEHVSQFRELRDVVRFGSTHSTGRIFRSLKEYNDEFTKVDKQSSGLKLNRGLEVDFSPRFEKTVGNFVNQMNWDSLLCSVHEFSNGKDIERWDEKPSTKVKTHERWREYIALEQTALEGDFVPFTVLAHPVRMSRATKAVPPEIANLLLDLATTAKKRGTALELNGCDIYYAPELVRLLAAACSKARCRVSLGSDAHYPSEVFRNMKTAMRLVEEFNLELL